MTERSLGPHAKIVSGLLTAEAGLHIGMTSERGALIRLIVSGVSVGAAIQEIQATVGDPDILSFPPQ